MRLNSLAVRLIAAAALWSLVVLPIAGYLLSSFYRTQIEQDFDVRLGDLMSLLQLASASGDGSPPRKPAEFGDLLFNLPVANGWYWQIEPFDSRNGNWRLLSNSLTGQPLKLPPPSGLSNPSDSGVLYNHRLPDGQRLRVNQIRVQDSSGETPTDYLYTITGNRDEIDQAVANFAFYLGMSLGVLGLGLLALTLLQVRFGLQPLRKIENGLARIRSGEADRLEGELPVEITPLQTELNALIKSNQDIIERARTHVGNLAHALKTPLSVIMNEARTSENQLASKVNEQAQVMRDQINLYLDRARMAARTGVIGGVTEVEPVVAGLARALSRIFEERQLSFEIDCPADLRFRGERQDLEEMLGNLMDNACKWASGVVALKASRVDSEIKGEAAALVITVDDDGPGLSPDQRQMALKRGRRLDESKPGSGLGLSIVGDLAELYQGSFDLAEAPLGGLRARLVLPAA